MSAAYLWLLFASASVLAFVVISSAVPRVYSAFWGFVSHTEFVMRGLFIFGNASFWVVAYIVLVVLVQLLILLFTGNLFLGAASLCGFVVLPRAVMNLLLRRRNRQIVESLPDALVQLSASLRAGISFPAAVQLLIDQQTGALAEELSLMLREQRIGISLHDALENLAERVQCEDMDLVVSAVMISHDVGGNLAGVLYELSATVRQKLLLEGKVQSLTAQGKLQAWVISALPLCVLGALVMMEPENTLPMFKGLLGWVCLSLMLLMQITGAMMIRKIVSISA